MWGFGKKSVSVPAPPPPQPDESTPVQGQGAPHVPSELAKFIEDLYPLEPAQAGQHVPSSEMSDAPSRSHPAISVDLQRQGCLTMATITPPQTNSTAAAPTRVAVCLVLDVSGSMMSTAEVTNDAGEKISYGFTLLDIVKHATLAYIGSLGASDWIRIVEYGSLAAEVAPWTACTPEAKETLDQLVRGLRTKGSTNMIDGINKGCDGFTDGSKSNCNDGAHHRLPDEVKLNAADFAMSLVVCTDGLPDERGHDWTGFLNRRMGQIEETVGLRPKVTAIGFGNSLDSALLASFSDVFLHIPDAGSVGSFVVNLVAATRSTANLAMPSSGGAVVANTARLIIEPASAVAAVLGFDCVPWRSGAAVAVDIGALMYDQPRHIVVRTKFASGLIVSVEVGGHEMCASGISVDVPTLAAAPENAAAKAFQTQLERLAVVSCMSLYKLQPAVMSDKLQTCVGLMADDDGNPLKQTIVDEVLLALKPDKLATWGKHYLTTLPFMLRLERRSNFRDMCLQGFGKDAQGENGMFEELSNQAEMVFSQLKPPEPSAGRGFGGGFGGVFGGAAPVQTFTSLPDEFMRGGGCFGPDATILLASTDGHTTSLPVKVSAVRAGDVLVGEGGRLATVVCVVMTECVGGKAMLTRLPNGLELTEWHPVRDRSGRWRFPHILGERTMRSTPYVYNFVLSPGHPTILVNGVPCAALGHGLEEPVVAHPYWGTRAVINDLMQRPGWQSGRVILPAVQSTASA